MQKLVWVGPGLPAELSATLSAMQFETLPFGDLSEALGAARSVEVTAALVDADVAGASLAVEQLRAARDDLQVLAVSRVTLPEPVRAALRAGAHQLVDLGGSSGVDIADVISRALDEHAAARRDRDLLARLRALNEEFLKAMVLADKRNMQLEEELATLTERPDDAPRRVLVVDDEPMICQLLEMALDGTGYVVSTATDGEQALAALAKERFDLVITDKNLPGISGHAIVREAKRRNPGSETIMMTAYGSKESVLEAMESGVSAYLEKPFDDITKVAERVAQVFAQKGEDDKRRRYLSQFKDKNREFLEQYRVIRAELDHALLRRGQKT